MLGSAIHPLPLKLFAQKAYLDPLVATANGESQLCIQNELHQ